VLNDPKHAGVGVLIEHAIAEHTDQPIPVQRINRRHQYLTTMGRTNEEGCPMDYSLLADGVPILLEKDPPS